MAPTLLSVLRSAGAVVAGFTVITLGTVLTFTVLVPEFGYSTSGPGDLLLGALGAVVSGLVGGLVAAWLAAQHPLRHAAALAIPIALDTATIVAKATPESDPLWFDLGGSVTLLVSALIGGYFVAARLRASGTPTAAARRARGRRPGC